MVRRVDRQGEVLIWCRKRFGYARQRMGPKLMDCCKPKKRGTKSNGKTLKTNPDPRRAERPCQECERLENRRAKKKGYQKEISKIERNLR